MWSNLPDSTKWVAALILAGIGAFFLIMTYGAMITNMKEGTHISGVPLVGGFFVFIGFMLSPVKWLAFLALIDPGIWMFPYSMWLNHKAKKEKEGKD